MLGFNEKPKILNNNPSHKKQYSLANYSIFKFLTSPRSTKNSNKILSSRMEVINLNKDMKPKKKQRDKKVYSSVVDTDTSSLAKKTTKRRIEKPGSSILNYSNEAVGLAIKTPVAYQIKPKKFKKRLTMGGLNSAKSKHTPSQNDIHTSQTRKSARKSRLASKGHLKSQSIMSDIKQ